MKKNIVFILFVLFSLAAEAQFIPGRQRQRVVDRTPGTTSAQRKPEFNVEKAVGLTIYDIDKILKRLKIKESADNYKKVVTIFNKFNREVRDVKRINGFLLGNAKTKIEAAQQKVLDTRDYSILQNAYKEVSEGFKPIAEEIKAKEKVLDSVLKPVLSAKEFKKWKKHQTNIKRKG